VNALGYLVYKFSDRLASINRLEFFDDIDGFRSGYRGLYTSFTTGLTYRVLDGLVVRPEFRYDHNDESRPFAGRADLYAFTINALFIY
jgi:hypothetical protein